MSSAYDRILASAPVNASTAKTMSRGIGWNPAIKLQDWYPDQPPTRRAKPNPRNPEWRDYTGVKVGHLTVLGVLDRPTTPTDGKSSWVCRCVCGCFCTRKSKSIRIGLDGGNSFVSECGRCDYQHKLQRGWTPELKNQPKVKL